MVKNEVYHVSQDKQEELMNGGNNRQFGWKLTERVDEGYRRGDGISIRNPSIWPSMEEDVDNFQEDSPMEIAEGKKRQRIVQEEMS